MDIFARDNEIALQKWEWKEWKITLRKDRFLYSTIISEKMDLFCIFKSFIWMFAVGNIFDAWT